MKWSMVGLLVALAGVALVVGCEGDWTSGGGVESWNDRYNWVNFSGVYRGLEGGVLVTDYSANAGVTGETYLAESETIATAAEGVSQYSGVLRHENVQPGSIEITTGVFTLTDPEGDGTLSGSGKVGTIDYGTGAWSIDLLGEYPPAGTAIVGTYLYKKEGSGGAGGANAGSSGVTIYSFTVQQEGQNLSIVDNNGSTYSGSMGSIRSSGGVDQDDGTSAVVGDQVIAQFTAHGTSKAGFSVNLAGTFQGTVSGSASGTYLSNRRMIGTWIEQGGRTGDINGEAAPLAVTIPTAATQ